MAGQRRKGGSVLVVDDDAGVRALVADLLEQAGYHARLAASGEEALESARRERPDLVVLDVLLPRLSGYEVCGELRDEYGTSLPILFISGERTESVDRVAGLLVGGDDYLVKPFALDELLARVHCLLRRSGPDRAVGVNLTNRELDVLRLLADGLGTLEIGRRLAISPKTVRTHIEHILSKLGVSSRTQAVGLAYRAHLVEV
ncbi:MAG: response regulator transcription factor [Gaiellaceae bacterium]